MNESIKLVLISPENSENSKKESDEFSVVDKINYQLITELSDNIISFPEMMLQKIRQIMYRNGFEIPDVPKLDTLGEELILELNQKEHRIHGKIEESFYLYLIYYLTDDKNYDIFAEIIDKDEMQEILNSVDDEDIEED